MGTFKKVNEQTIIEYGYDNKNVIVVGREIKNAENKLESVDGNVYRKNENGERGEYICNFTGTVKDEKVKYAMSAIDIEDMGIVKSMMEELEPNLKSN
jgi:hypothetical protein